MDSTTRAIIGSALSRNAKFLLLGMIYLSECKENVYFLPENAIRQLSIITEYENIEHMVFAMNKLIKKRHIIWVVEGECFRIGDKVLGPQEVA